MSLEIGRAAGELRGRLVAGDLDSPRARNAASALLRVLFPDAPERAAAPRPVEAVADLMAFHRARLSDLELVDETPDRQRAAVCLESLLEQQDFLALSVWDEMVAVAAGLCAWIMEIVRDVAISGDRRAVTELETLATVGVLRTYLDAARPRDGFDTEVAFAVAWALWLRYVESGADDHQLADFLDAVTLFEEVEESTDRATVLPSELREYWDRRVVRDGSLWIDHDRFTEPQDSGAVGRRIVKCRIQLGTTGSPTPVSDVRIKTELTDLLVQRALLTGHEEDLWEAADTADHLCRVCPSANVPMDLLAAAVTAATGAYYAFAAVHRSEAHARAAAQLAGAMVRLRDAGESGALDGMQCALYSSVGQLLSTITDSSEHLVHAVELFDRYTEPLDRLVDDEVRVVPHLLHSRYVIDRSETAFEAADRRVDEALRSSHLSEQTYRVLTVDRAHLHHLRWKTTADRTALDRAILLGRRALERRRIVGDGRPDPDLSETLATWLYERYVDRDHDADVVAMWKLLVVAASELRRPDPLLLTNVLMVAVGRGLVTDEDDVRSTMNALIGIARDPALGAEPTPARRWANVAAASVTVAGLLPERVRILEYAIHVAGEALTSAAADDTGCTFVASRARTVAALLLGRQTEAERHARHLTGLVLDGQDRVEALRIGMIVSIGAARSGTSGGPAALSIARDLAGSEEAKAGVRRQAAWLWGETAARGGDYSSAADAFLVVVALATGPEWRAQSPDQRRDATAEYPFVTENGISCALAAGRPLLALQILQTGRDVEGRRRRADRVSIEELRSRLPGEEKRITEIERALRGLDELGESERFADYLRAYARTEGALLPESGLDHHHDLMATLGESGAEHSERLARMRGDEVADQQVEHRMRLDAELRALTSRAGLAADPAVSSADPARLEQWAAGTRDDAVVLVNASWYGCDALVCRGGTTTRVPLQEMTAAESAERARALAEAIADWQEGGLDAVSAEAALRECRDWLWRIVVGPVIRSMQAGATGVPHRIWWCPTGVLSMLPFHAAEPAAGGDLMADIVSSYVTTLDDFAVPSAPDDATAAPVGTVLRATETNSLPGTRREGDAVAAAMRLRGVSVRGSSDLDGIVADVEASDWVHSACHGQPGLGRDARAGLWTAGGFLSTNRLRWITGARPRELAFLSACHSATFLSMTPGEPEHLVAGVQACGYRHVVAAMWGVVDTVAARVASKFYTALFADGATTADRTAEALHSATADIRDRSPLLWVPYVHFGP